MCEINKGSNFPSLHHAKNHAKQGIKEVRSKLKHKETDNEYGTCSSGLVPYSQIYTVHNSKRLDTEKQRLAQVGNRNCWALQQVKWNSQSYQKLMADSGGHRGITVREQS
ncbi:UNVERIFIED_CONTAM: hypothetical protein K2H54_035719 [Gekko kuhli]